jgi:pilus assembly protein Flp/PilA
MATEPKGTAKPRNATRLTPGEEETIMDLFIKFICDEAGASAVEYALLLSLIALAIITSVTTFGQAVRDSYQNSTTQMFGS